jgi:hypothetical protein
MYRKNLFIIISLQKKDSDFNDLYRCKVLMVDRQDFKALYEHMLLILFLCLKNLQKYYANHTQLFLLYAVQISC